MGVSSGNWSPTIWLLSAPAAIVTSAYLVYERHQHFPYHILIPQLLVALAIRLQKRSIDHGWRDLFQTARNGCRQLKSPTTSHVWSLLSTALAVTSLFAAYQAFFHMPNVLCTTFVLVLAPVCASSVCAFLMQPDRFTAARVAMLAICVFAILLNDYRLTPPGFFVVLLALGSHIGSHFCTVQSRRIDSPDAQDELESEDGPLWTLLAAVLPLFFAAPFSETPRAAGFEVSMAPVLLPINAIVGGIALANSDSLFMRPQAASDGSNIDLFSIDAPALVGLVFVGNALAGRGVVFSAWEIAAFAAAYLAGMTVSTYSEDAEYLDEYAISSQLPTWRKVLGFYEQQGWKGRVGLHESEPSVDESRARKAFRCSGKISAWQIARMALLGIAAMGWVCVLFSTFRQILRLENRPFMSETQYPQMDPGTFDIVVSYHDESLPKLASTLTSFLQLPNIAFLSKRILLYTKGSPAPLSELHENLTSALPPDVTLSVLDLPNVGREGETYLHHILDNYDTPALANHTLFIQADMHDPWYMRPRITQYFVPQTGFLSLWHMETICSSCADCRDTSPWEPALDTLQTVYGLANNGSDCADLVPTYRGQFIASAARIRANPREFWEGLRTRFTDAQEENPLWGYDLERWWGAMMQCPGGRRIGDRCPSMMSGMLGTVGELEDCQCVD